MVAYNSAKYKRWRSRVYKRDKFTCQLCGTKGFLNAHHIYRKADFPKWAFKTSNGIALCYTCHKIITNHESTFSRLFIKMNRKTLTLDYVYAFFEQLTKKYPDIVIEFQKFGKWLKIPKRLVKIINGK